MAICVLGCGAIGGSVAADLIEAGYDVTVVDQWPEHVEAMRSDGLVVTMPDGTVHVAVDALHPCDLAARRPAFDVVLVAVKSYDTEWSVRLVEPYLARDGVLVGVQNSMNDDLHADIVGSDRVMGCAIELSADIYEPGRVTRNTTRAGTWLAVGELDGTVTERAERIAELLSVVATAEVSSNIYGAKWTKLVANSMAMGPNGLFGLPSREAAALPGMRQVAARLGRESAAVGRALGYDLEPVFGLTEDDFAGASDDVLLKALDTLYEHIGPRAVTAIVQDTRKGRRSEYDFITGLVVRKGREAGIETPANAAVLEVYGMIDRGEVEMGVANLDRLHGLLAEA